MKGRPFLAVVLAVVLLTFSLGVGGWWLIWQRGPLQLAHHALTIPRAARFVPAQAPLSLYLLSDGEQPVAYARAVAPGRQRRNAGEAIERLRDGAFAAAGLDYHDELARWLAPGIALVLFDDPAAEISGAAASGPPSGGWLLALASRDDDGARHFLQRFWQTRSLAGTDLQVSNYRGMGLISGRGALVGSRSVPLATALVDDDLVLIASGRGVLERALDVSQIPELNQASQPGLQRELDQLGEGAALLLARPQALEQWLGWPLPLAPEQRPTQLLAALRPEGRSLLLHGHLQLPAPPLAIRALPISAGTTSQAANRAAATALSAVTRSASTAATAAVWRSDPQRASVSGAPAFVPAAIAPGAAASETLQAIPAAPGTPPSQIQQVTPAAPGVPVSSGASPPTPATPTAALPLAPTRSVPAVPAPALTDSVMTDPVVPAPVVPDPVVPYAVVPYAVVLDPVVPDAVVPDAVVPAPTRATPMPNAVTLDAAAAPGAVVIQPADPAQQQQLLDGLRGQLSSLLLLQNPAAQLQQPLVQPLLERALARTVAGGPLPATAAGLGGSAEPGGNAGESRQRPGQKRLASGDQRPAKGARSAAGTLPFLVAQRAEGPLLLAAGPQGWQLATASTQPAPEQLQGELAAAGLIQAPLELGDRSLLVWTRLEASSQRRAQAGGGESLQATLAAWRLASGPLAWWGRSLAVLDEPAGGRGSEELRTALAALDRAAAPLQWALTRGPSRELLRLWQPWQVLSALAGGGLDGGVQGLAMALQPEGRTLHLQARLSFER